MRRITIHLPTDLAVELEQVALRTGRSKADVIREVLYMMVIRDSAPVPTLPLFSSEDPELARQVDTALAGFGEDEQPD